MCNWCIIDLITQLSCSSYPPYIAPPPPPLPPNRPGPPRPGWNLGSKGDTGSNRAPGGWNLQYRTIISTKITSSYSHWWSGSYTWSKSSSLSQRIHDHSSRTPNNIPIYIYINNSSTNPNGDKSPAPKPKGSMSPL